MKLSLGIVGLPNVGKSTLFNALTQQEVLAANYPFATIEPNHGIVPVHDARLQRIAEIQNPDKTVPAVVEFVDIAGLVKGASEGEGLGNQFLANIREVSAIVQVVRAFEDDNITHVEHSIDPARDIDLIHTELQLKDLTSIQQRLSSLQSKARSNPKLRDGVTYLEALEQHISDGGLAYTFTQSASDEVYQVRKELFLLTDKPIIYVVNARDTEQEKAKELVESLVDGSIVIPMDIKTEAELVQIQDDEERKEFMDELGIEISGLDLLTQVAYDALGLISFFTSGPMESRAWTVVNGAFAPEAAGAIHTDIQQNFIAADVVSAEDFIEYKGWQGAKDAGKVRLEGKTYEMQDGDVVLFKHNG